MGTTYYVTNSGNNANNGLSLGAAFATLPYAASQATGAGDTIYISGSHTISADFSFSFTNDLSSPFQLIGFGTTPGDSGRATLTAAGTCTIVLDFTNHFMPAVEQMIIDCNGVADYGIKSNHYFAGVSRCWIKGFKTSALESSYATLVESEVSGGLGGSQAIYAQTVINCDVHHNTTNAALRCQNSDGNRIWANSNVAIYPMSFPYFHCNNTIDGNGGPGFYGLSFSGLGTSVRGNIVTNNGGRGIECGAYTQGIVDGNFFYNNAVAQASYGPNDVVLSGDPYVNRAAGNFALNNTAGAGAAIRAANIKNFSPAGTTANYLDGGSNQHQDSGGGGSVIVLDD